MKFELVGKGRKRQLPETKDEGTLMRMQTIHAVFQSDGAWFIARCLDLPVTTQGRTFAAAKKNLQEAVELYLETWGAPAKSRGAKEVYLTSMEVGA